eukprot:TRINITY_DN2368_c0_g1_i1.p2 TRINITY_DN2368_c0_g1~~TRINITY_DN2368_c0_g1_i1.p2  ORF type:complete len:183 (-),score=7.83 TRINITY_DN2368_c0_g1_i1:197-745(-)
MKLPANCECCTFTKKKMISIYNIQNFTKKILSQLQKLGILFFRGTQLNTKPANLIATNFDLPIILTFNGATGNLIPEGSKNFQNKTNEFYQVRKESTFVRQQFHVELYFKSKTIGRGLNRTLCQQIFYRETQQNHPKERSAKNSVCKQIAIVRYSAYQLSNFLNCISNLFNTYHPNKFKISL